MITVAKTKEASLNKRLNIIDEDREETEGVEESQNMFQVRITNSGKSTISPTILTS